MKSVLRTMNQMVWSGLDKDLTEDVLNQLLENRDILKEIKTIKISNDKKDAAAEVVARCILVELMGNAR